MILGNLFDHIWTTFRNNDLRTEIKIERPAKNTFPELKYPKKQVNNFATHQIGVQIRFRNVLCCHPFQQRHQDVEQSLQQPDSSHTLEELEAAVREEVLRIDEFTMDLVVANFARRLDVVVEKGDGGHFENVFV